MTAIATKQIATKFQVGVAACAVAAATTLVPVAAQAAPSISVPTAPVTQVLHELTLGPAALPAAPVCVVGVPSCGSKPRIVLLSFKSPILTAIAGLFGLLGTKFCVFGVCLKIGHYGRFSLSVGGL
jgi:hypothetical protein